MRLALFLAALGLVGQAPLLRGQSLHPDAGTSQIRYGESHLKEHQVFVAPLDFQKGVPLYPKVTTGQLYPGPAQPPWFMRLLRTPRHIVKVSQAGAVTFPADVSYPLGAFGREAGGSPLYTGQNYRFSFYAGGQTANSDVLGEFSILVYRKSDFIGSSTNVAPVAIHQMSLPHPKARSSDGGAEWTTFGDNGYQMVRTTQVGGQNVLETSIQFLYGSYKSDLWGAGELSPLLLSHKGLSSDYCYVVALAGRIAANGQYHWSCVANPADVNDGAPVLGYAMSFEAAAPWGTTLVKTPQFNGEPMPPHYLGKSAWELTNQHVRFEKQLEAAQVTDAANKSLAAPELQTHLALETLVNDLASDPIALANFVHNEIRLTDALGVNENGDVNEESVNAAGVNRGALATYMEGQGSPEEQCALLIYLMRRANVPAVYVKAARNQMKMTDRSLSNLLRMQLRNARTPTGAVEIGLPLNVTSTAAGTVRLKVQLGDHVAKDAVLAEILNSAPTPLVIATITAPAAGKVSGLLKNTGEAVGANGQVIKLEPDMHLLPVNYPWVAAHVDVDIEVSPGVFQKQKRWVHLFPWLKDTEVTEGRNISDYLPSTRKWVRDYLRGDTAAMAPLTAADFKNYAPSEFFTKFMDNLLKNTGVSLDHVGIRFRDRKRNNTVWNQFPQPWSVTDTIANPVKIAPTLASLANPGNLTEGLKTFDTVSLQIYPTSNVDANNDGVPDQPSHLIRIDDLMTMEMHNRRALVRCIPLTGHDGLPGPGVTYRIEFTLESYSPTDTGTAGDFTRPGVGQILRNRQVKSIIVGAHTNYAFKVIYKRHRLGPQSLPEPAPGEWQHFLGVQEVAQSETISSFGLGDTVALCMNHGRVTERMLRTHLDQIWKLQQNKPNATLTLQEREMLEGMTAHLMGMNYYYRVTRTFDELKDLFKVHATSMRAHGFSLMGAMKHAGGAPIVSNNRIRLAYPVIDMNFSRTAWAAYSDVRPDAGGQNSILGNDFMTNLYITEISGQEHLTIRDYYPRDDTDALSTVNLLHRVQLDDNASSNLVELRSDNYAALGETQFTFESQTQKLKEWMGTGIWSQVTALFQGWEADLARVYSTPGPVRGAKNIWKGMGVMLFGRDSAGALIGQLNGGFAYESFTLGAAMGFGHQGSFLGSDSSSFDFNITTGVSLAPSTSSIISNWASGTSNVSNFLSGGGNSYSNSGLYGLTNSSVANSISFSSGFGISTGVGYTPSILDSYVDYADNFQISLFNPVSIVTNAANTGTFHIGSFLGAGATNWQQDPVNVITGSFYTDQTDLTIPGSMPLVIRRNYDSQNPHHGEFGYRWKLAYVPYLVVSPTNMELIQAAEMDGSVIAYRRKPGDPTSWEVLAKDNPTLSNGNGFKIGSVNNLFHNYITLVKGTGNTNMNAVQDNDSFTVFGANGSRRMFTVRAFTVPGTPAGQTPLDRRRPYLDQWQDHAGNCYRFYYYDNDALHANYGQLRRVESSNGNYLGFIYNTQNEVTEAFTGDGRRIYYRYDDAGDLRQVTRPDGSVVKYDYLYEQGDPDPTDTVVSNVWYSTHLIEVEHLPEGRVIKNVFERDGAGKLIKPARVWKQYSTAGKTAAPPANNAGSWNAPVTESYDLTLTGEFIYNNTVYNNTGDTNDPDNQTRDGHTVLKDAYGRSIKYYYSRSRQTDVVDELQHRTSQEWWTQAEYDSNATGAYPRSLKASIDRRGLRTEFYYSRNGDVTSVQVIGDITGDGVSDTAVTTMTYNNVNRLPDTIVHPHRETGTANGVRTKYFYTDSAYPYLVTKIENQDANGTVISANRTAYTKTDPPAGQWKPFARGLPWKMWTGEDAVGSGGAYTLHGFSQNGFLTSKTFHTGTADPDVTMSYRYNLRSELEWVIDPAGQKTRHAYDDLGRRVWEERQDAAGNQLSWNFVYFNHNGEIEWTDGPRFSPEDYTYTRYDGMGRAVEKVGWRSWAKADGSGVEEMPGDSKFATAYNRYNLVGDLVTSIDPNGNSIRMKYDAIGRVIWKGGYQGDWDHGGSLLTEASTTYATVSFTVAGQTYQREGNVTELDSLRGQTVVAYTADGKPKSRTSPDGSVMTWEYYRDGRTKREPIDSWIYWHYTYDDLGRITTKVRKNGANQTFGQPVVTKANRRGEIIEASDLAGNVSTTSYDNLGRPKVASGPADFVVGGTTISKQQRLIFTYVDAAGTETKVTNALGECTRTVKDALGRTVLSEIRNLANQVIRTSTNQFRSDHHGYMVTEGSGPDAISSTVFTDTMNKTVLVMHGDGNFVLTDYDSLGQSVLTVNELHQVTQKGYDSLGRTVYTVLPDGAVTVFSHDNASTRPAGANPIASGGVVRRTMPGGLFEEVTSDFAGRVTKKVLGDNSGAVTRINQSYSYATSGQNIGMLQSFTDSRGGPNSYLYDNWRRVSSYTSGSVGAPSYIQRSYGYDDKGSVISIAETNGSGNVTVTRQYDGYNRLWEEKVSEGGGVVRHLSHRFDAAGRRIGLHRGSSDAGPAFSVAFGHRPDGLLTDVDTTLGGSSYAFDYTYGNNGLIASRTNPWRTATVGSRDNRGRLLTVGYRLTGSGADYLSETLAWTADSRQDSYRADRAGMVAGNAATVDFRDYTYNARNQLMSETTGSDTGAGPVNYGFDQNKPGGLGILTAALGPTSSGAGLGYVVGVPADVSGAVNGFGRVTREVTTDEPLLMNARGNALGAKSVAVQFQSPGGAQRLGGVHSFAGPLDSQGAFLHHLRLSPGNYLLGALASHPSGNPGSIATGSTSFAVGRSGVSVDLLYDGEGHVTKRTFLGWKVQDLTWDSQGRLIKVAERDSGQNGYNWTARYDGLNRRLWTNTVEVRANVEEPTTALREDSWYDPLREFLEICVQVTKAGATPRRTWKLHGPDADGSYGGLNGIGGLEAAIEEDRVENGVPVTGQKIALLDDYYGHIIGYVEAGEFRWNRTRCTGYGPLPGNHSPDLTMGANLAEGTAWRGRRMDVTGFYYLGSRYYEANSGRFLSPDPAGHAASMSLYCYAGGDPVNYADPDGRLQTSTSLSLGSSVNWGASSSSAQGSIGSSLSWDMGTFAQQLYQGTPQNSLLYTTAPGGVDSLSLLGGVIDIQSRDTPMWYTSSGALKEWGPKPGFGVMRPLPGADSADPYQLGIEWAQGIGPDLHLFGPGSPILDGLMQHHHVVATRNEVADQMVRLINSGVTTNTLQQFPSILKWNYDVGGPDGVILYFNDYTHLVSDVSQRAVGIDEPDANIVVAYLGSFGFKAFITELDPVNQTGTVRFQAKNQSSLASATHPPLIGYTSTWKEYAEPVITDLHQWWFSPNPDTGRRPGDTTTQFFIWDEQIDLSSKLNP